MIIIIIRQILSILYLGTKYILKIFENRKKHDKNYYEGPYELTKIDYDKHNAELIYEGHVKVTHIDNLKKAIVARQPGNIIEKPTLTSQTIKNL